MRGRRRHIIVDILHYALLQLVLSHFAPGIPLDWGVLLLTCGSHSDTAGSRS